VRPRARRVCAGGGGDVEQIRSVAWRCGAAGGAAGGPCSGADCPCFGAAADASPAAPPRRQCRRRRLCRPPGGADARGGSMSRDRRRAIPKPALWRVCAAATAAAVERPPRTATPRAISAAERQGGDSNDGVVGRGAGRRGGKRGVSVRARMRFWARGACCSARRLCWRRRGWPPLRCCRQSRAAASSTSATSGSTDVLAAGV